MKKLLAILTILLLTTSCGGSSDKATTAESSDNNTNNESCTTNSDCESGFVCSSSVCVKETETETETEEETETATEEETEEIACTTDNDNDGYISDECESGTDCDDNDASINTAATDLPDPDTEDTNCDGIDGDKDNAIWVSTSGDDSTGDGSIFNPYQTINKGMTEAASAQKDVYIINGDYNEDIEITENISLFGGFSTTLDENSNRDREIDYSDINNTTITLASAPLTISNLSENNNKLGGFTIINADNETAIYVENSSFTIEGNNIDATNISDSENGVSAGIYTDSASSELHTVTILNNMIITNGGWASVGIAGTSLESTVSMQIEGNTIEIGEASGITYGICMGTTPLSFNILYNNATIENNMITSGPNSNTSAGITLENSSGNNIIQNNFITGGDAINSNSYGINVSNTNSEIHNNTINSGNSLNSAMALKLGTNTTTSIQNNIFFSIGATTSYGIREANSTAEIVSLENNLFETGGIDTYYYDADTSTSYLTSDPSAMDSINAMEDIAAIGNNLSGSAYLVDSTDSTNYYIGNANSDAIDNGKTIPNIDKDILETSRPQGAAYDIGAHEYPD